MRSALFLDELLEHLFTESMLLECIPTTFVFCSFQGSPCEERNCRGDMDEGEMEEASPSGWEDSGDHTDILEWAKV